MRGLGSVSSAWPSSSLPCRRSGRARGALLVVMAWVGVSSSVLAQGTATPVPADGAKASHWLSRLHDAPLKESYQGTFVMSAGGQVASARIAHLCEGKAQYERIDTLDGPVKRIYRVNDTVQTVWVAPKVAVIERYGLGLGFPSVLNASGDRVSEHYTLTPLRVERVAGYDADVLLLKPKDGWRFGHQLWAERRSGLLLRAEVLNEAHEVLEWSAFSEVQIGQRLPLDQVALGPKGLDGFEVRHQRLEPTTLQQEGWISRVAVPGFSEVSCVRRAPDGVASPQGSVGSGGSTMVQAIYSDGLTHVSVFIEPFDEARHRRELLLTLGANHTLMQRIDQWWVTVMGDVPVATLRAFAEGLERRR